MQPEVADHSTFQTAQNITCYIVSAVAPEGVFRLIYQQELQNVLLCWQVV